MDQNGRAVGLSFIGTSTAGMKKEEAENLGADLAFKAKGVIEFYKHNKS